MYSKFGGFFFFLLYIKFILTLTKISWDTFGRFFSKTHLVTLSKSEWKMPKSKTLVASQTNMDTDECRMLQTGVNVGCEDYQ
jgi:hypothetical protein